MTNQATSQQVKLCGMDPAKSSAVVQRIWSVGTSTMIDAQKLCSLENEASSTSARPVRKGKVKTIVQGLREIGPLIARSENNVENPYIAQGLSAIGPIIAKSARNKEDQYSVHSLSSISPNKKSEGNKENQDSKSNKENQFFSENDSSDESDIEGFLEYARDLMDENNTSYDSASFRDFESVLQESIDQNFLEDDDDDEDSMTSASSYSGYHRDAKKRYLAENSLVSEASSRRLRGTIARKKLSWAQQKDNSNDIDSNMSLGNSEDDDTATTGTSYGVIRQRVQSGNPEILKKYQINGDDNSVVSKNSYKPRPRNRKRTFRKKRSRRRDLNHSVISEDAWDNVEQTIDELAIVLAQEKHHRDGHLSKNLSSVNKMTVLNQLKVQSPHLYEAVLTRIEREDAHADCHVTDSDYKNASQNDANVSDFGLTTLNDGDRSMRISLGTPDKPYWADKSQHGYDLSDDRGRSQDASPNGATVFAKPSPDQGKGARRPPKRDAVSVKSTGSDQGTMGHWEEILDVDSDEYSEPVPEISVDYASPFLQSSFEGEVTLGTILESSNLPECYDLDGEVTLDTILETSNNLPEGYDLDGMIETFLTDKIARLTGKMNERQAIMERKHRLLEQLKQQYAYLRPQSSSTTIDQNCDEESAFPNMTCKRGRALIRKIQRKRKALILARRQRQDETVHAEIPKRSPSPEIPRDDQRHSMSPCQNCAPLSPVEYANTSIPEHEEFGGHEEDLENFLFRRRPPSPQETTRRSLQKARAKRKSILKSQLRGRAGEKPLYESMEDSDDSFGRRPPPPPTSVVKVRFARKRNESKYETLPETNNSFLELALESDEFLKVIAPPSPESPIRDYRLSESRDTSGFNKAASEGILREDDHHFSFGEEETYGASLGVDSSLAEEPVNKLADHSFSDIVRRTPRIITSDEEEVFVNIRKVSPTSIADFFDEDAVYQPRKPHRTDFAYVEEPRKPHRTDFAYVEEPRKPHRTDFAYVDEPRKPQRNDFAYVDESRKPQRNVLAFVDEEEDDPVFTDVSYDDDITYIDSATLDDDTVTEFVEANFISATQFEI